jgi:hypothetical protein
VREHFTPLLPNYWYIMAVRKITFDSSSGGWLISALQLAAVGLILLGLAAVVLRRRVERGGQS